MDIAFTKRLMMFVVIEVVCVIVLTGVVYCFIRWGLPLLRSRFSAGYRAKSSNATSVMLMIRPYKAEWREDTRNGEPVIMLIAGLEMKNDTSEDVQLVSAAVKGMKAEPYYFDSVIIPKGNIQYVGMVFYVEQPMKQDKKLLKSDVNIVDQFGNTYCLKGLGFCKEEFRG